jgi:tRNA pseudouridine13 synthase
MTDPLDPPRAFAGPTGSGRIKRVPEHFFVSELLGFEPSGDGQHLLVHVRKRGVDTQWVARRLAEAAGVGPSAVGYAGLKDRHAVVEQWFSLDLGGVGRRADLVGLPDSIVVLAVHRHDRKLRIGALQGNRFEIRIADLRDAQPADLEERLQVLRARGVPNYFGEQRFGRARANLRVAERLLIDGARVKRRVDRAFAYSAARSLLFNALLARRVVDASWDRLAVGDLANLDGGNGYFAVEQVDDVLRSRERRLEIHATGPLWGEGEPETSGEPRRLEDEVCGAHPFAIGLEDQGVKRARRPLRAGVRELQWAFDGDALALSFRLRSGSYATSVLREIALVRDASAAPG